MALTDREREYLSKLKKEGKTKEQATALLNAVRQKLGQTSGSGTNAPAPAQQAGPVLPASVAQQRGISGEKPVGPVLPDDIAGVRGIKAPVSGENAGKVGVMREGLTNPEVAEKQADEFWKKTLPSSMYKTASVVKENLAEPVVKGLAETGAGVVGIADKGVEKLGGDLVQDDKINKVKEFSEADGIIQEVVKTGSQAVIGGGLGSKLFTKLLGPSLSALGSMGSKGQKAAKALGFLGSSAGSTTGAVGATEQRLPTGGELATGLVVDGFMAGLSKAVRPERLISKAMGLTPTQKKDLSKIVSSVKNADGTPVYKDIDDFALKNNISGGREAMVQRAKDMFEEASASKEELLKGVKEATENKFPKLFDELKKTYKVAGQEETFDLINQLSKKKNLTAVELEKVRYLADNMLPASSYTDTSPIKTQGLQKMIDEVRDTLAGMDKTGQLKKFNLHKRVLSELGSTGKSLTQSLEQSAKRSVFGQASFRGGTAGAATAGASYIPVVGDFVAASSAAIGAFETLMSIPQVASVIVNLNKSGQLNSFIEGIADPIAKKAAMEIIEQMGKKEPEKD